MPKRTDIESILVIGSGPIVIGQACEFDYSGTQACRVLRQEGYRVVLVNSNPATIMTDPELSASPVGEILLEQSIAGWKEYELEVMRDGADNAVVVCSIENLDPMGTHTGDSITVAPAQTLTDVEYQAMRDAAFACIRRIGVETGGSNIQFAVNPADGEMVVIEMNPRVSRSSALASKATGFPIAKIAAKLAVGYTLDEIPNDITRVTMASFEPSIDYVVVKIPRFAFEKFPQTDSVLTTQMKSVGEVMAIGRTFKEALQKAIRSLEVDRYGFEPHPSLAEGDPDEVVAQIRERLRRPDPERLWHVADALRVGISVDEIYMLTKIDRWFLNQMKDILAVEDQLASVKHPLPAPRLREAKQLGFSDHRLGELLKVQEGEIRRLRIAEGVTAVFKRVDTCAAEFPALTPYLYSTYESKCESQPQARQKVMILGGGPNRIGQGIRS